MNKVPGPPKINKHKNNIQGHINKHKTQIQLGVILGVILGVPKSVRVSGAQKVLRLINTAYVQLITFWGVSLGEKMDDPQDDPQDGQPVSPVRLIKSWPEFSIFLAFMIVN